MTAARTNGTSALARGRLVGRVAEDPVNDLSWPWIALMLTAPPAAGALIAYPLWRRNEMILGNLVGAALIFATAFGLIAREYVVLDRATQECLKAGYTCWPVPNPFMRYAIYACIALVEVIGLFIVSLRIERKRRNRLYSPEWR